MPSQIARRPRLSQFRTALREPFRTALREPFRTALREPSAHPHIRKARTEPSASLFVSHTAKLVLRTSVKFVLVLSHTGPLSVSQIPSPTRPTLNLDEHSSLGVTPESRATAGDYSERNARSCLSRFLVYTVTVSIIDASAQSFRLAYIDALSFSLVSLK